MVPPAEVPERAERILAAIEDARLGEIRAPTAAGPRPIRRVHTDDYLEFLEHVHSRWLTATGLPATSEAVPYVRAIRDSQATESQGPPPLAAWHVIAQLGWFSHDADPILAGTWAAATAAVDIAMTAWTEVVDERAPGAYALCRPPGHHAAADSFAGYCYLNNAAIVADAWTDRGARVAILDVDFHHGNGTQQIFYDRDDVLFVSLHADPADEYPYFLGFAHEHGRGAGMGNTCNFPLPAGTAWDTYGTALTEAVAAVRAFAPDGLVVSLGVDTAREDDDSFDLVGDDYLRLGAAIGGARTPTVFVQEGGYCLDVIGRNVVNVLRGYEDA